MLNNARSLVAITLLATIAAFSESEVKATVFSQTGAELITNPDVAFPTVTPVLDASTVRFGDGVVDREILLQWNLFPAGTIGAGDPTTNIRITAEMQRLVNSAGFGDWDPFIALSDGTNILGGFFAENDSGTYIVQNGDSTTDGLTQQLSASTQLIVGGAPSVGDIATLVLDLTLDPGFGSLTMSGFNSSLSTGPFLFDRTGPLSILVSRSNSNETIRLLNLEVETSATAVSEPATFALVGLGLIGLGVARNRRKKVV